MLEAATAPALDIRALSKTYVSRDGVQVQAVNNVSCSIGACEFVSILGPSGCGKSTLLMMIADLIKPTSGEIVLHHRPGDDPSLPDFGIVFQDALLFPWRDVEGNIELPGEVVHWDKARRSARARELLNLVGLADFGRKYPFELSGGMQQRVAIARALMLSPSLLLMDEPFGALDAMTREQMNLEIQRISLESKATVIFVTHSIAEAAFLSDRVFVMSGRPSTIRAVVDIPIPRPRSLNLLASDDLGSYILQLRSLFDDAATGGQ
jgi:NitT/TauT family transport system ATP-binding protein